MTQPDPRDYHPTRGERDTVLTYLRNYRLTFEMKLEGLGPEEYARHVGHADLLRERIDGRTGS